MKSNVFQEGQYLILERGVGNFLLVQVVNSSPLVRTKVRILNEDLDSWELNLFLYDLENGLELVRNHLKYTQKLSEQILELIQEK